MNAVPAQLPLQFEIRNACSFETLVAGDNAATIGIARQCALQQGEKQLLVWAQAGHGKSHLLQACCQLAASHDYKVCYLPAGELSAVGVDALQGLEQLDLICIDDVHALFGHSAWERALFDLVNRCREQHARLILSSRLAPEQWRIGLPDLASRLQWGPVFQLKALSDRQKITALQRRAELRGMQLPDRVAHYMLAHFPRDLFTLFERLDQLDQASLAQHRKLTIPFVRQTLSEFEV